LNATVDYMLHGIMYLLVSGSYKNRKVASFLSIVGVLNVIVGFSSLDFKYYNHCNQWILGLPANQPLTSGCGYWIGGYGAFTTVLLAVAAISAMICTRDKSLSAETLLFEMCPYFIASTSLYFVADPLWVTELYDKIKYDQLYFILPIFFHLITKVSEKRSTCQSPVAAFATQFA